MGSFEFLDSEKYISESLLSWFLNGPCTMLFLYLHKAVSESASDEKIRAMGKSKSRSILGLMSDVEMVH